MDVADTVPFDLPCDACGYNLRGADVGGNCPECGRTVWEVLGVVVKKGLAAEVKWIRLRDRPSSFVRGLRAGAALAFVANALMLAAICVGPAAVWLGRYSNWLRYGYEALLEVCFFAVSAASAILALLLFGRALLTVAEAGRRVTWGGWLLMAGAIAYPAILGAVALSPTKLGPEFTDGPKELVLFVAACAVVMALAAGLRILYLQWWLRVERKSWLAWPVAGTAVPVLILLFLIAFNFSGLTQPWRYRFAGENSWLLVLSTTPMPTNGWPLTIQNSWEQLRYAYARGPIYWATAIAFTLIQLTVISGDGMLAWLAHGELRRRRLQPSEPIPAKLSA